MSKNIFVAIEGIDGSGKSAVSILLARDINASLIKTPPPSLENIRSFFDQCQNMTARFMFYASSVVLVSRQIEEELKTRPVVCDRYINSTICYHEAMGVDTSLIEIDKLEIVKPDICICLTVSEKIRVQRIKNRQNSSIAPYKEVSADFLLRVSNDLVNHSTHVIDTSLLTPEETKRKILQIISKTPVEHS